MSKVVAQQCISTTLGDVWKHAYLSPRILSQNNANHSKMSPASRIAELASIIHEQTDKVDAYLTSNNLPTPSFDISCPPKLFLPPEVQASRDAVLEASDELTALMLGPVESLIPPV